jgi:hypothetical protein
MPPPRPPGTRRPRHLGPVPPPSRSSRGSRPCEEFPGRGEAPPGPAVRHGPGGWRKYGRRRWGHAGGRHEERANALAGARLGLVDQDRDQEDHTVKVILCPFARRSSSFRTRPRESERSIGTPAAFGRTMGFQRTDANCSCAEGPMFPPTLPPSRSRCARASKSHVAMDCKMTASVTLLIRIGIACEVSADIAAVAESSAPALSRNRLARAAPTTHCQRAFTRLGSRRVRSLIRIEFAWRGTYLAPSLFAPEIHVTPSDWACFHNYHRIRYFDRQRVGR